VQLPLHPVPPLAYATLTLLQRELERYLFYYQRYANHDAAGRFAAKHRETAQRVRGCSRSDDAARRFRCPSARICAATNHLIFDQSCRHPHPHPSLPAQRMSELQEAGGLSYTDVTFLNDATEALLEVRGVAE
jgi:hypothetical protein